MKKRCTDEQILGFLSKRRLRCRSWRYAGNMYLAMPPFKIGHVPLIHYQCPGDPVVRELIAGKIKKAQADGVSIHAVMLDRLGLSVWHKDLASAIAILEGLEETAKLWMTVKPKPAPLSEAALQVLRDQFDLLW